MDGNIFNSSGSPVGKVLGPKIFDLKGNSSMTSKASRYTSFLANWSATWRMRTAPKSN
jgi:hypothetical protein